MEIIAKAESSLPEFLEARQWHWKRYGSLQYWWYVAGVVFIVFGGLILDFEAVAPGLYVIIFGIYCLLRKKLLEYRFRRNLKKAPGFEKATEWRIRESGFTHSSELGISELKWSAIYESISTKRGFLIYPQKGLYYWIPRSGFASEEEFSEADRVLKTSTKNKNLD